MRISFDQYIDSIVAGCQFNADLTEAEVATERAAMRSRVLAQVEAEAPAWVLARWKSAGVEVADCDNPGVEVHGQV